MRRIALTAVMATAAGLISVFVATSTAGAGPVGNPPLPDTTAAIPLGTVSDLVVDQAAGLVFYAGLAPSQLPSNGHGGGIAVSHLDGSHMANVHGTTSTTKLALGPDGKIYGLQERGVITVIDPSTLTVTDHAVASTAGCPTSIAFVGTQTWLSYGCGPGGKQGLAAYDFSDDSVTPFPLARADFAGGPYIAAVPNHPNMLVGSSLTGPGELSLIDVSGSTPAVTATTASLFGSSEWAPIPFVVTADGSTILAASLGQHGVGSWSTAGLARGTVYRSPLANVVTDNADGTDIAAASSYDCTIATFTNTTIAPVRSYLSGLDAKPKERGCPTSLAWAGSSVLAVYTGGARGWPLLHVLNGPMQAPTTMRFSGPRTVARATSLTVTGQLVGLPNTSVIITKRDLAGAHALGTVTTDANGNFSLPDLPRVGGPNTYVARYLGDPTHGGTATAAVVNVSRGTVPLTVRIDRTTYNFHDIAQVSIHLAPHDVKKVQLWVRAGWTVPRYQTTLTVDGQGNAHYSYRMAYNTDFLVRFYGDYYYNAREVGVIGGTRPLVTETVSGQHTIEGQYLVFMGTAEVSATAVPESAQTPVFQAQRLLSGQWVSAPGPNYLNYGAYGLDGQFTRSRLGYYRLRAVSHADIANVAGASPWIYIKFTGWDTAK